MKQMVLDCSVSLAWMLEDETNAYTESVLAELSKMEVVVPSLWPLEMTNGLLVAQRRKRVSMEKLYQMVEVLGGFPIVIDELTAKQATGMTVHLAHHYSLSSYDAAYLELAVRLGAMLATQDKHLKKAAVHCAVKIF